MMTHYRRAILPVLLCLVLLTPGCLENIPGMTSEDGTPDLEPWQELIDEEDWNAYQEFLNSTGEYTLTDDEWELWLSYQNMTAGNSLNETEWLQWVAFQNITDGYQLNETEWSQWLAFQNITIGHVLNETEWDMWLEFHNMTSDISINESQWDDYQELLETSMDDSMISVDIEDWAEWQRWLTLMNDTEWWLWNETVARDRQLYLDGIVWTDLPGGYDDGIDRYIKMVIYVEPDYVEYHGGEENTTKRIQEVIDYHYLYDTDWGEDVGAMKTYLVDIVFMNASIERVYGDGSYGYGVNETDYADLLSEFHKYRVSALDNGTYFGDSNFLFTVDDFYSSVLGYASLPGLDILWSAGGVIMGGDQDTEFESLIFYHELGHNLGQRHDGNGNDCDEESYIQASVGNYDGYRPDAFSTCSIVYTEDFFEDYASTVSRTLIPPPQIIPIAGASHNITNDSSTWNLLLDIDSGDLGDPSRMDEGPSDWLTGDATVIIGNVSYPTTFINETQLRILDIPINDLVNGATIELSIETERWGTCTGFFTLA